MNLHTLPQTLFAALKDNDPLEMKACEGILSDFGTAYAVQRAVAELKGEPTGGYKISLTSKTAQVLFDERAALRRAGSLAHPRRPRDARA